MIRKSSNGYTVYARTGRPMGTYRTREQAEVRLGQLEAFKAQRAPQMSPTVRPKRGGYYVRAKSGRNMGWYPTKAEALRRKGQLEANGAKFFKETRGYTRQGSPSRVYGPLRHAEQLVHDYRTENPKSRAQGILKLVKNTSATKQRGCVLCGATGPTWSGQYPETKRAREWAAEHVERHLGAHSWPGQPRRHARAAKLGVTASAAVTWHDARASTLSILRLAWPDDGVKVEGSGRKHFTPRHETRITPAVGRGYRIACRKDVS